MFDRIVASMPEELIPQNIDGHFIQGRRAFFHAKSIDAAFNAELPEMTPAVKHHRYVNGVDPALTFDSTWAIVLDITGPGKVRGVFANRHHGRATGPVIAQIATLAHTSYNQAGVSVCETAIDATGFGGKMFRDLLYITPLRSVEFGGTRGRKLRLLNTLKEYLEAGRLEFPRSGRWLELRRQLLGYRIEDRGLETDAVMALAVAVYLVAMNPAGGTQLSPFDYFGVGEPSSSSHKGVGLPPHATVTGLIETVKRGM